MQFGSQSGERDITVCEEKLPELKKENIQINVRRARRYEITENPARKLSLPLETDETGTWRPHKY